MILLAIDPGFDKLGYSVFEKSGKGNTAFTYIASRLIKTNPKHEHQKRLEFIYSELQQVIGQYKPELMVVEQLFFFKNQKTVIQVAQAIGVIELLGAQHDLRMERLTPLQIKQIVTGDGGADKKAVEKMIRLTLKKDIMFADDDEADAVACGLAYCFINEDLK